MEIVSRIEKQKVTGGIDPPTLQKPIPLDNEKEIPLLELIKEGESDTLEFKASMLKPTHTHPGIQEMEAMIKKTRGDEEKKTFQSKLNKLQKIVLEELRNAVIKTIAAFMNSEGGILLVGVQDDGQVYGIESDFETLNERKDWDGWVQFLVNLIRDEIGTEFTRCIKIKRISHENKTVAQIIVEKSARPAYVESKTVEFYIRSLNTTHELNTKQASDYIHDHWRYS
jgi:predicted HTH transcriptional regulator